MHCLANLSFILIIAHQLAWTAGYWQGNGTLAGWCSAEKYYYFMWAYQLHQRLLEECMSVYQKGCLGRNPLRFNNYPKAQYTYILEQYAR